MWGGFNLDMLGKHLLLAVVLLLTLPPSASGILYYVDHTKTGGTGSGTDTTNAFLSIKTPLEANYMVPGDTIYIRAGHTETLTSNINVYKDGSYQNPIVVLVDDGTIWPSTPSGEAVITCGSYYISHSSDDFWIYDGGVNRLHFQSMSSRVFYLYGSEMVHIRNVDMTDISSGTPYMVYNYRSNVILENCRLDGNSIGTDGTNAGYGLYCYIGVTKLYNTKFNGLSYGIYNYGGTVYLIGCAFENEETNINDFNFAAPGGMVRGYNCYAPSGINVSSVSSASYLDTNMYLGYFDSSYRQNSYIHWYNLKITTDYSNARSGGADYALKVQVSSYYSTDVWKQPIFKYFVPCDSAETKSYTVYVKRSSSAQADGLELNVYYLAGDSLDVASATTTLTNADTWYSITVSDVTPEHNGPVMVELDCVNAGSGLNLAYYVDPLIEVTGESYEVLYNFGAPDLASLYTTPTPGGGYNIIFDADTYLRHGFWFDSTGVKRWRD
jgi:hypothetical protein